MKPVVFERYSDENAEHRRVGSLTCELCHGERDALFNVAEVTARERERFGSLLGAAQVPPGTLFRERVCRDCFGQVAEHVRPGAGFVEREPAR